jgi:flagellar motor switch protein FliN/FliY
MDAALERGCFPDRDDLSKLGSGGRSRHAQDTCMLRPRAGEKSVNETVTKAGGHWLQNVKNRSGDVLVSTLDKVSLDIQVVLGTTTMPVHQVLRLGRGAIIELESSEDDEVDILANSLPVAKGTVVVSGNRIAVEVRELLPRLVDIP